MSYSKHQAKKKDSVLVGVRGGAGSLLTAIILKKQGFDVKCINFYCKKDEEDEAVQLIPQQLSHDNEIEEICSKLGLALHRYDVSKAFKEKIISPYIESKIEMKFFDYDRALAYFILGELHQLSQSRGESYAMGYFCKKATGSDGNTVILSHSDVEMDESELLGRCTQESLRNVLLPLGDLGKKEASNLISNFKLPAISPKNYSFSILELLREHYGSFEKEMDFLIAEEESVVLSYDVSKFDFELEEKTYYVKDISHFNRRIECQEFNEDYASLYLLGRLNFFLEKSQYEGENYYMKNREGHFIEVKLSLKTLDSCLVELTKEELYPLGSRISLYDKKMGSYRLVLCGELVGKDIEDEESRHTVDFSL